MEKNKKRRRGGPDYFLNGFPHIESKEKAREIYDANKNKKERTKALVHFDEECFVKKYCKKKEEEEEEEGIVVEEYCLPRVTTPNSAFEYIEITGDLFKQPKDVSLAHCVSECLSMGKGIAVPFKKTFGGVLELKSQGVKSGGVAYLKRGERFVFYLITKEKYWHKPSYENVWKSLQELKRLCIEHSISKISMPLIACGLDSLRWKRIKEMIYATFEELPIQVTIVFWEG